MKNILVFCFIILGFTSVYSQDTSKFYVYDSAQIMPSFPGDLNKWISNKIYYPDYELSHDIQGTVYVSFIVDKNGSVDSVKISKGVWFNINNEAVSVVSSMPKWSPGMQNGKPVRVRYVLPINFILQ